MPKLDRQSRRRLSKILNRASADINDALAAYQTQSFTQLHAARLGAAHGKVGWLMATFEDREHASVDGYTLHLIETYETLAADLLYAIQATGDRRDEIERSPTGRYACARYVMIDGVPFSEARVCNNPAFGFAALDDWEADLRRNQRDAA